MASSCGVQAARLWGQRASLKYTRQQLIAELNVFPPDAQTLISSFSRKTSGPSSLSFLPHGTFPDTGSGFVVPVSASTVLASGL